MVKALIFLFFYFPSSLESYYPVVKMAHCAKLLPRKKLLKTYEATGYR